MCVKQFYTFEYNLKLVLASEQWHNLPMNEMRTTDSPLRLVMLLTLSALQKHAKSLTCGRFCHRIVCVCNRFDSQAR